MVDRVLRPVVRTLRQAGADFGRRGSDLGRVSRACLRVCVGLREFITVVGRDVKNEACQNHLFFISLTHGKMLPLLYIYHLHVSINQKSNYAKTTPTHE